MIHKIFTVFDQKAQAYLPPFFLHQEGMATRSFSDAVNDKEHQFGAHPEDYTLFSIGTYDDERGMLEPHLAPQVIGNGLEFVQARGMNEPVNPEQLAEFREAIENHVESPKRNDASVQSGPNSGNST